MPAESTAVRMPYATLADIFDAIASRARPDLLRVKVSGSWHAISSEVFAARVRGLAAYLVAAGVAHQDRVALLAHNRPEWTIADFAMQMVGAVNVPIYPTSSREQIRHLLGNSGCRLAIVSGGDLLARFLEASSGISSLRGAIVLDPGAGAGEPPGSEGPPCIALAEALDRGRALLVQEPSFLDLRRRAVRPHDLASIIYTSGTTGDPKGVMLTHANFCSNIDACLRVLPIRETDVALSFLPLSHVFERTVEYVYLCAGGRIAYAEGHDRVAANLLEIRPTVLSSVPRVLEKVYGRVQERARAAPPFRRRVFRWASAVGRERLASVLSCRPVSPWTAMKLRIADGLVFSRVRQGLGGRIRLVISGGAPLPKEIAEFFLGAGITLLEGYGLTETSPVIAVNTPRRLRPGTVGPILPGVEVKIAEDGEILVRGPNVMKGYFGDPGATRSVMRDGYLATGDVGFVDADGFLTITDRKKDLIVTSSGKNVAPQPIENAIKSSRFISNVILIGEGRRFVAALIVPDFEAVHRYASDRGLGTTTPAEVIRSKEVERLIASEIETALAPFANFEKVRKFTMLDHDFTAEAGEVTPTLKVRRKIVLERYRESIEAMYRA